MRHLLNRLIPFLMLGIGLTAIAFGIVILAYLFLFGAIVGLILFSITWIRQKFFPNKVVKSVKKGRTIDSDDWNVL